MEYNPSMRIEPTEAEKTCVEALLQAFRNQGHAAERIPRPVEDRPDALLRVGGVLVACECVQIPPEYIFKQLHKKHPPSAWKGRSVLSSLWPNEPHQWVADAVKKKSVLHQSYLESTGANESWLLVHTPVQPNQAFLDGSKEWIQWAVRHGAKMVNHPFHQIFLWTPQHEIYPVWNKERDESTHSELGIGLSEGYPTICTNRFFLKFKTLCAEEAGPKEKRFLFDDSHLTKVRPMDAEYRRHKPATRRVIYEINARIWADRAEFSRVVVFVDTGERIDMGSVSEERLTPDKTHWHHVFHEFHAPKTLQTHHVIQHF